MSRNDVFWSSRVPLFTMVNRPDGSKQMRAAASRNYFRVAAQIENCSVHFKPSE